MLSPNRLQSVNEAEQTPQHSESKYQSLYKNFNNDHNYYTIIILRITISTQPKIIITKRYTFYFFQASINNIDCLSVQYTVNNIE